MDRSGWQELVNNLRGANYPHGQDAACYLMIHQIEFEAPLTDAGVLAVEGRFNFQFPPDLREFLQTALSRGRAFLNTSPFAFRASREPSSLCSVLL